MDTFASRTTTGKDGKQISIITNHFPISYNSNIQVYHYDITIEEMLNVHKLSGDMTSHMNIEDRSDESKRRFRRLNNKIYRVVVEEARKQHSGENGLFHNVFPIFDGQKNIYSVKRLPIEDHTTGDTLSTTSSGSESHKPWARIFVNVVDDGRNVEYALMLKLASIIDMRALKMYFNGVIKTLPHECLQVLNILLSHGPTMNKIPIGNSLYSTYNESRNLRTNIGDGRQLAYGHFQSVRPLQCGVNLIVDRACTAFYVYKPIPQFIAGILRLDRNAFQSLTQFSDSQRGRIRKELIGLQVQVRHLTYKRRYKVIDISRDSANNTRFEVKTTDPRGTVQSLGVRSVVEFFRDRYPKLTLNYSHLPCLIVGSNKNPNYLPIDVCELVPDQSVHKNLSSEQTAAMIKLSASQLPIQRLEIIKNSTNEIINDSKTYLKDFEVNVQQQNQPLIVNGRILGAPLMGYAMDKTVSPNNGKWDLKSCHFFSAASLDNWFIMAFTDRSTEYFPELINQIKSAGNRFGMKVSDPLKRVKIQPKAEHIRHAFVQAKRLSIDGLKLIVFIVDPKISHLYEVIKLIGDCEQSVITQCVKETNMDNIKIPYMNNLILKINTKLGGINGVVKNPMIKKRTMFVGIDCSHPGVGDQLTSSMAACVGSYDEHYVKYSSVVRKQYKTDDITKNLLEMTVELLNSYSERNSGILPENIIIYRDGISEGQFDSALKNEIFVLIEGFKKYKVNYNPLMTFIVVQKRHHTRFFPSKAHEGIGRANNVPPGLVIDTSVVSKTHFDYYLCSHEGIQGTSCPTHYYVLWDTNGFTADELQRITFNLTHVYARCNRSISTPAPVTYAHLAAYRAQRHASGTRVGDTDSQSGSQYSDPRRHNIPETDPTIAVESEYRTQLYYC